MTAVRSADTADELRTNERGEIAQSQRERLQASRRWLMLPAVLTLACAALLAAFLVAGMSPLWGGAAAIAAIYFCVAGLAKRRRILRDLARGIVAQDRGFAGRSTYGSAYRPVMTVGSRTLTAADWLRAEPGHYLLHYLPESGIVLSAESAGSPHDAEVETLLALAGAFSVNGRVLRANRSGRLDPRQFPRVCWLHAGNIIVAAVFFGFAAVNAVSPPPFDPRIVAALGGGLAFAGVAFLIPLVARLTRRRVATIDGAVDVARVLSRSGTRYFFKIDKRDYPVSIGAYSALDASLAYRAYVVPRVRIVVAIEPLDLVREPVESFGL